MSRFFRSVGDSDSESSSSEEELMSSGEEEEKPAPARPAGGMSRFLRTAGSDSSSEDSEEYDESISDDDERKAAPKKKNRFAPDSDDEESEDEVKRVVKSAKDKRFDEMEACAKSMDNALKINDWVAISSEFDKLTRLVQRQTNVAERVSGVFLKTLIGLEGSITSASAKEKESKKKMNKTNAKALVGAKNKVKMAQKEYESSLKQYQTDPEAYDRVTQEQEREPTKIQKSQLDKIAEIGEDESENFTTVGKGGKSLTFSAETVLKNLVQIQEARGKKGTDRHEQIRILEKLLEVSSTPYQQIRVLLALVSSRFDYSPSAAYMPLELWTAAKREIDSLVALITSTPGYTIEENPPEYDELVERSPEKEPVRIRGSIISFLDRLDDEFMKSLQNLDPHGTDYVERLKDETGLYVTVCRCQAYYMDVGQSDSLFRAIMRRIEHIYSKPAIVVQTLEYAVSQITRDDDSKHAEKFDPSNLVHSLCAQLYRSGNSLLRTRSMLWHIYHHALYNDFHTARDMLLMSHLQENIHAADVPTQILYNRAIVQLGLCAFRSGLIKESQSILLEIFSTQRVKELLAQGTYHSRQSILTPEQEKAEKLRQIPFHMHINTELLEGAFLVSSMLVEIPMIAGIDSEELKRKAISKPFRRLLDFAERQTFSGPPETTRDHIMQASKALQDGDWKRCRDLVLDIQIWSLMPEEKRVKEMLSRRIQEEGLRTYLHTFAAQYTTLSLALLSRTFDLSLPNVRSLVSRMIWSDELPASLDQSSEVVVFHRVQPSREQQLALSLADRINQLVEHNEKTLDLKLGGGNWQERSTTAQTAKESARDERSRTSIRGVTKGVKGSRFAQGLGNRMGANNSRSVIAA